MLEFHALHKAFDERQVLRGLTFTVRPGELFGFCGANGAGKTTAMRIALGVLQADRGEVRLNGKTVDAASRARIGYMPEERGLYAKMTPRDQLVHFAVLSGVDRTTARRRAEEWMERLKVVAGPKDALEKLSLGNQQKVQLIASLIHEPDVLVLDEPFSGLDPVAVDAMADALVDFSRRGVPVVFSSHQLDLVERLCDRVGIVRDGALVAEGTVGELRDGAGRGPLEVELSDASADWTDGLNRIDGVEVLQTEGRTVLLRVDDDVPAGRILAVAQAAGEIEHFGRRRPALSDIFRESVGG
ncbi:ATP-binding cassette domain-containing protein [Streptomyces sp. NPDC006283]|uniref:ABC transporter ATP-binding protein n=1 Tax=Streptomyces sp. NPDC006283 TaxID=3156741 RepID=UPI0033A770EB